MIVAKRLSSFAVILAGLALGYAVQVLATRGLSRPPVLLDTLRKGHHHRALLFVNAVAIVGATWIVTIRDPAPAALPLVGLFAIVTGGVLAIGAARLLRLPPKKTGALFCCGSLTNIGSIGALVCYLYLGEPGFALVPIYKIFEELLYDSTGFPIAKHYSGSITSEGRRDRVKGLARDPLILISVTALLLCGALNASGLGRPDVYGDINAVFIPLGAFMLLIPPSIYDLDLDLADSCWFVTTAPLALVLPALLFATRAL